MHSFHTQNKRLETFFIILNVSNVSNLEKKSKTRIFIPLDSIIS